MGVSTWSYLVGTSWFVLNHFVSTSIDTNILRCPPLSCLISDSNSKVFFKNKVDHMSLLILLRAIRKRRLVFDTEPSKVMEAPNKNAIDIAVRHSSWILFEEDSSQTSWSGSDEVNSSQKSVPCCPWGIHNKWWLSFWKMEQFLHKVKADTENIIAESQVQYYDVWLPRLTNAFHVCIHNQVDSRQIRVQV